MLVWVPHEEAFDYLGDLPPGVWLQHWDAEDPIPSNVEDVEFYVPATANPAAVSVVDSMKRLKVIQLLSAGADWMLGAQRPEVSVCCARGVHSQATAEWVLGAIVAVLRDFPQFIRQQARKEWKARLTDELRGKRVLLLGYGGIGQIVEKLLLPFDCEIVRVTRTERPNCVQFADVVPVLNRFDIVVILLPLTDASRGLLTRELLSLLQDGTLVVNASRGEIVDTTALVDELMNERIHAAIDVCDPEPLPASHALWDCPNVLITPHVGGSTRSILARSYMFVAQQIWRQFRGEELLHVVSTTGY